MPWIDIDECIYFLTGPLVDKRCYLLMCHSLVFLVGFISNITYT